MQHSCFVGQDAIDYLINTMKEDGQELDTSDAVILAEEMITAGMWVCFCCLAACVYMCMLLLCFSALASLGFVSVVN